MNMFNKTQKIKKSILYPKTKRMANQSFGDKTKIKNNGSL